MWPLYNSIFQVLRLLNNMGIPSSLKTTHFESSMLWVARPSVSSYNNIIWWWRWCSNYTTEKSLAITEKSDLDSVSVLRKGNWKGWEKGDGNIKQIRRGIDIHSSTKASIRCTARPQTNGLPLRRATCFLHELSLRGDPVQRSLELATKPTLPGLPKTLPN